jgi:hypothetical protein
MNQLTTSCEKIINCEMKVYELMQKFNNAQELYKMTSDLEIPIFPQQIIKILKLYMSEQMSKDEIVTLSLFIMMSGCYTTPKNDDDYYYDDLWTIVSEISCPEIDGEITAQRAVEYIDRLKILIESESK